MSKVKIFFYLVLAFIFYICFVAFKNFEEFLNEYETVLELFDQERSQNGSRHHVNAGTPGSWDESKMLYNRSGLQKEPTNILYIALKVGDNELEITDKLNHCAGLVNFFIPLPSVVLKGKVIKKSTTMTMTMTHMCDVL